MKKMKQISLILITAVAVLTFNNCKNSNNHDQSQTSKCCEKQKNSSNNEIKVKVYDSGFKYSKGNYNGISSASDGNIYYVLCSGELDVGGQLYRYLPKTDKIEHLGDITGECGEKDMKAIPQGKSHVLFHECENKLYFATHLDYYEKTNGENKKEVKAAAPEGYNPYPGGHMLSYDMITGEFDDLCLAYEGEGVITFTMDTIRKRMYGITWPTGYVLRYDIPTKTKKVFGKYFDDGETGEGETFQVLPRVMNVDHRDGSVYFGCAEGDLFKYDYEKDEIETIKTDNLRKNALGCMDPHSSYGFMWRQAVWSNLDNKIYGSFIKSEHLVSYSPDEGKFEFIDKLHTDNIRKKGIMSGYGASLGFEMGNDGHTLYKISFNSDERDDVFYYVNGVLDVYKNHHYSDMHLVSYDLLTNKRTDHGKIKFADGVKANLINCLTIGKDDTFYAMAYIDVQDSLTSTDLISFSIK